MHYGEIKKTDIANGEGVRTALFVSGCTHHCKGCFNQETWDFKYGKEFTEETEEEILSALAPAHIAGLSLLGGEPMEPGNQRALCHIAVSGAASLHFLHSIQHRRQVTAHRKSAVWGAIFG